MASAQVYKNSNSLYLDGPSVGHFIHTLHAIVDPGGVA